MTRQKLLILLCALMATVSARAHDFEVDGIYYKITDDAAKTVAVTYRGTSYQEYSNEYSGTVNIPSSVTYSEITYSVTTIDNYAFDLCSRLKAVTIPNSVISIGNYSFHCCGLISVTIPSSITSIGERAFYVCSNLKTLRIEDGETQLVLNKSNYGDGYPSFEYCTIENLYVGRNLSSWQALCNSSSLKNVEIGETVTTIGENAFRDCNGLTSLKMGKSVNSIAIGAFYGCSGLSRVSISDIEAWCKIKFGISTDNYVIFKNNFGWRTPYVMARTNNWDYCTVADGFPGDKMQYLGDNIWVWEVPKGKTPTIIYFSNGRELTTKESNYVNKGIYNYNNVSGALVDVVVNDGQYSVISNPIEYAHHLYVNDEQVTHMNIPESITSIGLGAFVGCTDLTSVTIPQSTTSVGDYAFQGCNNLKTVYNCSKLTFTKGSTNYGYVAYYAENVYNQSVVADSGLIFQHNGENLNIVGYKGTETNISIPSAFNGKSVVAIVDDCFRENTTLKGVVIPESITTLGIRCFYKCTALTNVILPQSITLLPQSCFNTCTSLTTIEVPSSVTEIGPYCFNSCTSLTSVEIPNLVSSIGNNAFVGCSKLSVDLSGCNLTANAGAFNGVKALTIGNNVTISGSASNTGIDKVFWLKNEEPKIKGNVTYTSADYNGCTTMPYLSSRFKDGVFSCIPISPSERTCIIVDCDYLMDDTELELPQTVSYRGVEFKVAELGTYLLSRQENITSLAIDCDVATIPSNFANGNEKIPSMTIPSSVSEIKNDAFYGCSGITEVVFKDSEEPITLGYNSNRQGLFHDCAIENLHVGRNLTYGTSANEGFSPFYNLSTLKSVTFGNDVKEIKDNEFHGCSSLTDIVIPENTVSIGSNAFYGCSSISEINLPNIVSEIGNNAFRNCSSLTGINIPSAVTSIGDNALAGCESLTNMVFYDAVEPLKIGGNLCPNSPLEYVRIGRNLEWGEAGAGSGDDDAEYVYRKTDRIEAGGWYVIAANVDGQLKAAQPLASGKDYGYLPSKTVSVNEDGSFTISDDCRFKFITANVSTSEGTIPMWLIQDTYGRFYCLIEDYNSFNVSSELQFGLWSVQFDGNGYAIITNSSINKTIQYDPTYGTYAAYSDVRGQYPSLYAGSWEKVNKAPAKSQYQNGSPFSGKTTLRTVWVTDVPTTVPDYMFYNCSNLENVYVGDNVAVIGERAFSGCQSLKKFQFGKKVQSIGADAFSDCTGITDIYAEPSTPPTCGTQALDDLDHWTCTLHVPESAITAYQAAPQWKEFFFIDDDFQVAISEESISLGVGQSFMLTAVTYDDAPIRWESSNPSVAIVHPVDDSETPSQINQHMARVAAGSEAHYSKCVIEIVGDGVATVAAFNGNDVMASCQINGKGESTSIEDVQISPDENGVISQEGLYTVYTINGTCLLLNGDYEAFKNLHLTPGIYIVNRGKILVK